MEAGDGFTMELLLRVPKDKPPVIGIVFRRIKEACILNQDLVNELPELPYYIRVRDNSSKGISFEIMSDKLQGTRLYKDVKYDRDKFENFLFVTRQRNVFTFAHLLYDFDQYFSVSTLERNKKFELKIERIYMMQNHFN
jgi:hypothetical protein